MTDNDKPRLAKLGAGSREPAERINMDVSGTTGPDYLGQETVDVPGHSQDRPGVRSRLPEEDAHKTRISKMDTGEELPVLLSSSMKTDPIEGTQGSYTTIVEGECPRCGYDRLRVTHVTLPGEHKEQCMACEAIIDPRIDDGGYRMPTTPADRRSRKRESGERIGEVMGDGIYDMESSTGMGPYISIVSGSGTPKQIRKDSVLDIARMLVRNGDVSNVDILSLLSETEDVVSDDDIMDSDLMPLDRVALFLALKREWVEAIANEQSE